MRGPMARPVQMPTGPPKASARDMQFYPAPSSPDHPAARSALIRRRRAWSAIAAAERPEPDEPIEDEDLEDEDVLVGTVHGAAEDTAGTIAVGTLAVDGPHENGTRPARIHLVAAAGGLGIAHRSSRQDAPRRFAAAVRPGPTIFAVNGRDADELVLIRLDAAPTTIVRLALRAGERGPVDDMPSNSVQGTTETSAVDLAPGHYLLLCRVSGRLPSALAGQPSAVA